MYWKIAGLLDQMNILIRESRQQNYQTIVNRINGMMGDLNEIVGCIVKNPDQFGTEPEYIVQILTGLLQAQENEDYVMYGDLLQLQMVPYLIEIQDWNRANDSNTELLEENEYTYERNMDRMQERDERLYATLVKWEEIWKDSDHVNVTYNVEPTTIGFPTLAISNAGRAYYLHSNYDPYEDARYFAATYYDVNQTDYIVYGLGLGYHIAMLAGKDRSAKIYVYESDIAILHYCVKYGRLDWYFDNSNIAIVYDPAFTMLQAQITKKPDAKVIVHRPSVHNIMHEGIRQRMEELARKENAVRIFEDAFIQNSRVNFKLCDAYVDELQPAFAGKQVIIVAGGPSLDKNVELLRNKADNTVIFAVGAVFRKLVSLGIEVDYVIVIDPKLITRNQIKGLEHQTTPMLLLSTAVREIAQHYAGKKYLICQQGYDRAEQYARERGYHVYSSGGSVTTTALDVAIHFRAESIVFVGLDLAFTGEQLHAAGSGIQVAMSEDEAAIEVPSVDGGVVRTCRPFDICRKWIEHRILEPDVTMSIYDATEGGAKIMGTETVRLESVLQTR